MIRLNDLEFELADILLSIVEKKGWRLTYAEVANELTKRLGRNVSHHYGLNIPLGNVSIVCFELGLPLISAWVIYTDNSGKADRVSDGFYNFACDYRPEYKNMSPIDAWKSELDKIRKCSDWSPLRAYLNGETQVKTGESKSKKVSEEERERQESFERKIQLQKLYQESKATDPVFPDEVEESSVTCKEGTVKQVLIDVRERNHNARRICIGKYGTKCAACDIDLGDLYGAEFSGKLHVHHLTPISSIAEEHEIDPLQDLRPVCPNCHAIIHSRRDAPYSIDEVKAMIVNNRK